MTVCTEKDMRTFDDALRDCRCHLFGLRATAKWSRCGKVRREEQPRHGAVMPRGSRDGVLFCQWCGQELCPECVANDRRPA